MEEDVRDHTGLFLEWKGTDLPDLTLATAFGFLLGRINLQRLTSAPSHPDFHEGGDKS